MLDTILNYDTQFFLYLNNLGSERFDWFWLFITHKYSSIPLYIFMAYLLKKNKKWSWFGVSFFFILLLITIVDMSIDDIIRPYFQRLRPYRELDRSMFRVLGSTGGTYGFFSAHASNSFAFATIIFLYLKDKYKYVWGIFIWAILTSYSRIYVGVHYPTDVLAGSLYGSILGVIIYKIRSLVKV